MRTSVAVKISGVNNYDRFKYATIHIGSGGVLIIKRIGLWTLQTYNSKTWEWARHQIQNDDDY